VNAYTVSAGDLWSLAPEIWLAAVGSLILLLEAFAPAMRRAWTLLALIGTVGAGWLVLNCVPASSTFHGEIESSGVTAVGSIIVLLAASLALLASDGYLRRENILSGEYHALMLWSAAGMTLMLRATGLLTVFIALELLSVCLYALAGYHRRIAVAAVGVDHAACLVGAHEVRLQLQNLREVVDCLGRIAGAAIAGAAVEVTDIHLLARQASAAHHPSARGRARAVLCCGAAR